MSYTPYALVLDEMRTTRMDFFSVRLMSGGCVGRRVSFSSWSCRSCGRGFGGGLRRLFLLEIDDRGGEGPLFGHDGEGEGGQHEDGGDGDRELAQEVGRATASEDGLTGASERCADLSALAGLQEDRADHEKTDEHMDDDEQRIHGTPIS